MLRVHLNFAAILLLLLTHASGAERKIAKPGVKEVQVPFQSLKPSATFKIGKTADWVLVTDDAVWVGGSKPYSVQRIDPWPLTLTLLTRCTVYRFPRRSRGGHRISLRPLLPQSAPAGQRRLKNSAVPPLPP